MNEYLAEITLDLDCRKLPPQIAAGQYDKGRKCMIHITANDVSYSAAGATAVIKGRRQDKSYFSENCTIDNSGNVVFTMSEATLAVSGFSYAKVVLSDGTRTYSTQLFIIDVDNGLEGDVTVIDSFSVFNDCLRLLAELLGVADATSRLDQYITVDDVLNSFAHADTDNVFSAEFTANRFIHKYAIAGSSLPETTISKTTLGKLPLRYTVAVNENGEWFVPISYTVDTESYKNIVWKQILTKEDMANYVPKTRKIAGVDLQDDIATAELKTALSVPTKTSDLTNDSSFMSQEQTNTAITNAISGITTVRFRVVSTLPPIQGSQSNIIYLVPNEDSDDDNLYDEWIVINNAWEPLGSTRIDLSGKVDKTRKIAGVDLEDDITAAELKTALSVPTKTSDLTNDSGFLTQHQDISGKADIEDVPEYLRDLTDGDKAIVKYEASSAPPTSETSDSYVVPCLWEYNGDLWYVYEDTGTGGRHLYSSILLTQVIPTNVSAFINDAGYLTAQGITGKMDLAQIRVSIDNDTQVKQGQFLVVGGNVWLKTGAYGAAGHLVLEDQANKVNSISSSSTNDQYPSALAVKNYVDTVLGNVETLLSQV